MAAGNGNKGGNALVGWVVFPLAAVKIYAYWQLSRIADNWGVKLFSSLSDTLTQMAIILAINTVVVLILSMSRSKQ